jgi:hypothetical protein
MNINYTDLIFKGIVLVMLVWALKGYIVERTKKVKAKDQYLTQEEIENHCQKEHKVLKSCFVRKIDHLGELIKKDLEHGNEKFDKIQTDIDTHKTLLADVGSTLRLLLKQNDIKAGAE